MSSGNAQSQPSQQPIVTTQEHQVKAAVSHGMKTEFQAESTK
jgi:hypothetical protein